MATRSQDARLTDIIEACGRLQKLLANTTLFAFERDWQNQWLVERGAEIISEASRHLSDDLKTRHPQIPWRNVAGIGNVLRHSYERIAPAILWALVQSELPALEKICSGELDLMSGGAEPPATLDPAT